MRQNIHKIILYIRKKDFGECLGIIYERNYKNIRGNFIALSEEKRGGGIILLELLVIILALFTKK